MTKQLQPIVEYMPLAAEPVEYQADPEPPDYAPEIIPPYEPESTYFMTAAEFAERQRDCERAIEARAMMMHLAESVKYVHRRVCADGLHHRARRNAFETMREMKHLETTLKKEVIL